MFVGCWGSIQDDSKQGNHTSPRSTEISGGHMSVALEKTTTFVSPKAVTAGSAGLFFPRGPSNLHTLALGIFSSHPFTLPLLEIQVFTSFGFSVSKISPYTHQSQSIFTESSYFNILGARKMISLASSCSHSPIHHESHLYQSSLCLL